MLGTEIGVTAGVATGDVRVDVADAEEEAGRWMLVVGGRKLFEHIVGDDESMGRLIAGSSTGEEAGVDGTVAGGAISVSQLKMLLLEPGCP